VKPARNVCLVLTGPRSADVLEVVAHPKDSVDVFELRIDCLEAADRRPEEVARIVRAAERPVIATCRATDEGGRFPDTDDRREALLRSALEAGAHLVDVELAWLKRDPALAARLSWDRIQASHHRPHPFTNALEDIFAELLRTPAAAIKLVGPADSFVEAVRLVHLTRLGSRCGRRTSCFSLGPVSRLSRILATIDGSFLTYVTEDEDPPVPGMLTLEEAVSVYHLGDQPYPVKLLGILGWPLRHSLSPVMHNEVIRKLGERYLFVPFESQDPLPIIEFVRREDVRGLAVTIPHKVSVLPLLDGLDASAQAAGAVNTVVRKGNRLIGHNTDLLAARGIFGEWGLGSKSRVVVLGAGGAARAVLAALRERGALAIVVNRDRKRASDLARAFGGSEMPEADLEGKDYDVLVNATPLGREGETVAAPLPEGESAAVLDLAYRKESTPLTEAARASGVRSCDGLEFLARQGAEQYALWTKRVAQKDLYRLVLQKHVAGLASDSRGPAMVAPPTRSARR